MKKITTIITWGTVIFIWAIAIFMVVPEIFGLHPYIVLSGSMEPKVPVGSVVYVRKIKENPKINDIVAFQLENGEEVLHRIIEQKEDGTYITKGDANNTIDGVKLKKDNITGIYAMHIPQIGYLVSILDAKVIQIGNFQIPAFISVIIGVILLLNVITFLLENRKEIL